MEVLDCEVKMNDIVYFLIPILLLIVLVFADYLITELKFLVIMLKIERCEKYAKKSKKELLEIMKND